MRAWLWVPDTWRTPPCSGCGFPYTVEMAKGKPPPHSTRPPIADGAQLWAAIDAQIKAQGRKQSEVMRSASLHHTCANYLRQERAHARQDTWVRVAQALGCRWALVPDIRLVRIKVEPAAQVHRMLPRDGLQA